MYTSCGDDDATYTPAPTLDVTSADLRFEATGGTGSVVVNTTGALEATTTSKWVHLTVNGNQVTVVVDENTTLDGRSANIVLKSAGATGQVTATQKGGTYGLAGGTVYTLSDDVDTLRVPVVHTSAVEVTSLADWITVKFDASTDEIEFAVGANDTGWRRTGQVAIETGIIHDTITISQFDYLNDVQGTYALVYTASSGQTYTFVQLERTDNANGGQLRFLQGAEAELGIAIPITLDAKTQSFTIYNLTDLGVKWTYKEVEYDLMTMINYTNGTSIYRNKNPELAAIATMGEDEDGVFFEFDGNDIYDHSKYEFYALRIAYTTGGYEGYKGAYKTYPSCYLVRM